MLFEPVVASLPSSTITGTSAADVRSTTPGTNALVDTISADTITSIMTRLRITGDGDDEIVINDTVSLTNSVVAGSGADTISIGTAASSVAAGLQC